MHVSERVVSARIPGVEVQGAQAPVVRTLVVRSFHQAERLHRENRVITGHVSRPRRQDRCDARAHAFDIARQVIERMPFLQCEHITWILFEQAMRYGLESS